VADKNIGQETVIFRSAGGRAPVHVLDALHSAQNWRIFNAEFGVALPHTWVGDVLYARRQEPVTDKAVFCSMPGELHTTPRIYKPGAFSVLLFEPEVFAGYIAEHGLTRGAWRKVFSEISPELRREIARVLRVARTQTTDMEAQSAIVGLFEVMLPELFDGAEHRPQAAVSERAAARIRECLHADMTGSLDLETLAAHCGLSRFQALRSFKRRYGLPPHAYQLCLKVSLARRLLQGGYSSTEVAATCGFADQSHFGRVFKRSVGMTPASYGTAVANTNGSTSSGTWPVSIDQVLAQSDSRVRSGGR
jgi:AraC-like DNA-binding protein